MKSITATLDHIHYAEDYFAISGAGNGIGSSITATYSYTSGT